MKKAEKTLKEALRYNVSVVALSDTSVTSAVTLVTEPCVRMVLDDATSASAVVVIAAVGVGVVVVAVVAVVVIAAAVAAVVAIIVVAVGCYSITAAVKVVFAVGSHLAEGYPC